MRFIEKKWSKLTENEYLIFTIGYESRSTYLYSLCEDSRNKDNTLVFTIQNNQADKNIQKRIINKQIAPFECRYSDYNTVISSINQFIQRIPDDGELHIDYSSMPRSWYCRIPTMLCIKDSIKVSMWYSAGIYPNKYSVYPSAVDSIFVFSGKTLPSANVKRYHIMGLGFDAIRSETIRSVVEPETLICCSAYDARNQIMKQTINENNKGLLQSSVLNISVPINNFCGIINTLRGVINDLLLEGAQIILIPDGPKPLILGMSLIPYLTKQPGVTCLHIKSNEKQYKQVLIKPKGEIWGFTIDNSQ